jgi:hypothetical protein
LLLLALCKKAAMIRSNHFDRQNKQFNNSSYYNHTISLEKCNRSIGAVACSSHQQHHQQGSFGDDNDGSDHHPDDGKNVIPSSGKKNTTMTTTVSSARISTARIDFQH